MVIPILILLHAAHRSELKRNADGISRSLSDVFAFLTHGTASLEEAKRLLAIKQTYVFRFIHVIVIIDIIAVMGFINIIVIIDIIAIMVFYYS